MTTVIKQDHLDEPVLEHARQEFCALRPELTVQEALETIRRQGLGDRIQYFYITSGEGRLLGVLPTRRLLTAEPGVRLDAIMVRRVVALPDSATVADACEFFVIHKLLAFPVVDKMKRIVGVIDVSVFTEEVFEFAEKREIENLFQLIGLRAEEIRRPSVFGAYRFRIVWLVITSTVGIVCAALAGLFQGTLEQAVALSFFLAVVLGLGESISIQAMSMMVQRLHDKAVQAQLLVASIAREVTVSALLGLTCGLIVGGACYFWFGRADLAQILILAITAACASAGMIGTAIPFGLKVLRLNLQVASGPITLALADVSTLTLYLGLASLML